MKIHLNVLARPMSSHEAEFEQLVDLLDAALWRAPDTPNPYTTTKSKGLLWWRKERVFDFEAAYARIDAISEPHFTQLGAPVVGRDAEANEWLKKALANKEIEAKSEADALERYGGFHVLELLPENDGFPIYSAFNWDRNFDRACFYGTALQACSSVVGEELTTYLHGPLLASELAEWGQKLRLRADELAQKHQLESVLGQRDPMIDEDPAATVQIVDQAARWAAFWSSRGHGTTPLSNHIKTHQSGDTTRLRDFAN